MRRKIRWLIVFLLALLCFESARAQEARLANGVAIKGEVLLATVSDSSGISSSMQAASNSTLFGSNEIPYGNYGRTTFTNSY